MRIPKHREDEEQNVGLQTDALFRQVTTNIYFKIQIE